MKKITALSEKQLEKYSRQILISDIGYKGQLTLMNASVVVLGCGGLGSSALGSLAMSGIQRIGIVDFDKVSLSNLNRQSLFGEKDIGLDKVIVAKKKILSINPEILIESHNTKLTKNNINKILYKFKFVLDCTDNFRSRYLINDYCYHNKKILISAALHNFEIQLFNIKAWKNNKNPCYRCIFPKHKNLNKIGNCADMGIISPVAGIGGMLQAMSLIKQIIKPCEKDFKKFLIHDLMNMSQKNINVTKDNNCILCKK